MKTRIEDIFITYANNSLKENPEILYNLFEQFKHLKVSVPEEDEEAIDEIIKHFAAFVKCDDLKAAKEIRKKTKPKDNRYLEVAFEAVYAYRDGYCEHKCSQRAQRGFFLGGEYFIGPKRVKCYECEHLEFEKILVAIMEGKGYLDSELTPLVRYGQTVKYCLHSIKTDLIPGIPPPESFEGMSLLFYLDELFSIAGSDLRESFGKIFPGTIVAHSLREFLANNDWRKLKKCPYCHDFFPARDIRRQRCYSDDCRKIYERIKKEKQREKDPVKYC